MDPCFCGDERKKEGDRGKSNRRGDGDFSELSNIKGKNYKEAEKDT
ncbi:hypothetical protein H5U35_08560 [Candidatus Aerophobetes bacterium]|nr:hypothetical protein [Candidatus Aerophobetes bacterium]